MVKVDEQEVARLVETWENTDSKELAKLFADFLYRIEVGQKGDSSRYFSKNDVDLFKGITLEAIDPYPYTLLYRNLEDYLKTRKEIRFPFQLNQTIINGKHFFEMIRSYYKMLLAELYENLIGLNSTAKEIIETIDTYEGRNRTGDKYARMLFDCALLFYIDKFFIQFISSHLIITYHFKRMLPLFVWSAEREQLFLFLFSNNASNSNKRVEYGSIFINNSLK